MRARLGQLRFHGAHRTTERGGDVGFAQVVPVAQSHGGALPRWQCAYGGPDGARGCGIGRGGGRLLVAFCAQVAKFDPGAPTSIARQVDHGAPHVRRRIYRLPEAPPARERPNERLHDDFFGATTIAHQQVRETTQASVFGFEERDDRGPGVADRVINGIGRQGAGVHFRDHTMYDTQPSSLVASASQKCEIRPNTTAGSSVRMNSSLSTSRNARVSASINA